MLQHTSKPDNSAVTQLAL